MHYWRKSHRWLQNLLHFVCQIQTTCNIDLNPRIFLKIQMTELGKSDKYYLQLQVTWSICGCALKFMNWSSNKYLLNDSLSFLTYLLPRNEQSDRSEAVICMQKKVAAIWFPQNANITLCFAGLTASCTGCWYSASFRVRNVHGYCILHYTNFCSTGRDKYSRQASNVSLELQPLTTSQTKSHFS